MEKIIYARLKKEIEENKAIFYSGIPNPVNYKPNLVLKTEFAIDGNEGEAERSRSFS